MAKVLVIDDSEAICEAFSELVRNIGHEAACEYTYASGLEQAVAGDFDVIFLDVHLPDGNGLDILPHLKALAVPPEVIIMTGLGDPDGAELTIKNGAWDYLQKPLSPKKILLPLKRVLKYRDNLRELTVPLPMKRCGIVGDGPAIRATLDRMAVAARGSATVLFNGETGSGKELFARALHENSPRAGRSLVVVDCAAIPANLMESTLFGHVRGAYTGAEGARPGLIREANGGTLFLDELGELPLELQKKFLRVLQEKRCRPVGAQHEVTSDFRLVAATNRNLEEMVARGEFREDLLYRLCSVTIRLPPLRERMEDLDDLVRVLAEGIYDKNNIESKTYAPDFMEALRSYDWPGNVRELSNTLESAILGAYFEPELFAKHLPERMRICMLRQNLADASDAVCLSSETRAHLPAHGIRAGVEAWLWERKDGLGYKTFREDILGIVDEVYFSRLMDEAGWNIHRACEISGLGKSRIYAQLKKYDIDK